MSAFRAYLHLIKFIAKSSHQSVVQNSGWLLRKADNLVNSGKKWLMTVNPGPQFTKDSALTPQQAQTIQQRLVIALPKEHPSQRFTSSTSSPGHGQVSFLELSSKETAESVARDTAKLVENLKEPTSSTRNSLEVLETLRNVASFVPKIPSYFSKLTKTEEESNVKSDGDNESTKTHWKDRRVTINAKVISKAAVDARTRSCVWALRERQKDDESQCLGRLETLCLHLLHYPYAKGVAIRQHVVGEILNIRRTYSNPAIRLQANEALHLLGHHDPVPSRGIRILSLDGGGMRGVVALEVLAEMERVTGKKIYELFDFICGVSTGSIILSFLAFHKMSVAEVESLYLKLGTQVFSGDLLSGTKGWVMSHAYYNTKNYEQVLQSFVGSTTLNETRRSQGTPLTAIVATLVNDHKISPYVFRNYHYPYHSQSFFRGTARSCVWEAVRASSAAPGYFDEFSHLGKIFHDGGMLTNNATNIAIHEAQRVFPFDPLHCVVSLGMGRHEHPIPYESEDDDKSKAKSLSLAQKFARIVDAATDTELTHIALHDLLDGSVYYRFNPYMSEYFPLDEARPNMMSIMKEDSRMYIRRNRTRILEACDKLTQTKSPWKRMSDFASDCNEVAKAKVFNSSDAKKEMI